MIDQRRLIILITIIFLNVPLSWSQPVRDHGQLSVKGTHIMDVHGNELMLQGVSYGWHNWWPRFYTKESVAWLAEDWKCMVVRAAMGVEPEKGYLHSPEWSREKIEAVIQGALENDIYVIIDWHSHGIQTDAAKGFFADMAKKYGDYPHIIYEIYNEPVEDTWEEVKSYSIEVIESIRAYDPDNIILVGNPHWDQDLHIVADDPIIGYDNLMYTLHFYAAGHDKSLRDRADDALKKGVPIFVSESAGMNYDGDGPLDYEKWDQWINWMKKNRISWVTWSISDKDESCSRLKTTAGSTGNWKESDLKESGIKTRALLRAGIE